MLESDSSGTVDAQAEKQGHEGSGVSTKSLVWSLIALVILVPGSMVFLNWLAGTASNENTTSELRTSPLLDTDSPPPKPRLDARQPLQLEKSRKEEAELLSRYEAAGAQSGIGKIPVEQAMEVLANRGLIKFNDLAGTPLAKPEPVESTAPADKP